MSSVLKQLSSWYTNINFHTCASLKLQTNFEKAYWNPPQNSLHGDWLMFSSVDPSLAALKMRQNLLLHATCCMIYRTTGDFLVKLHTNFEKAYWNLPQNSLHGDCSMFSSVDPSLASLKMRQNILSHATCGMILQDHRWLPECIFIVKMEWLLTGT